MQAVNGRRARKISPALIFWLLAIAFVHMLGSFFLSWQELQITIAVLGVLFCVVGFWSDGKRRITAPGIALFAAGLFVFFPGAALPFGLGLDLEDVNLVSALTIGFVSHVLMYYVAWKPRQATDMVIHPVEPKVARWGMCIGFLLLAAAVAASRTPLAKTSAGGLVEGAAYVGVVLFALAVLRREKRIVFAYIFIGLAFVAYVEFTFSGFGRLKLGSLALALALLASHRWKGRAVKAVILLALVPGLAYLGASRTEFTATLNPNQDDSVTGIGSVMGPAARFGQLLDLDAAGHITYSWGQTFYASLVAMVPREIWPSKPVGFGAILADLFRPELHGTGHSELGLLYGEFLYGFGLVGLVIMVPIYAWFVNKLDDLMVNRQPTAVNDIRGLLALVTVVVVASSLVDLMWGGTFAYVSRIGPRLMIILVLLAMFGWTTPAVKARLRGPSANLSPAYRHMVKRRQAEQDRSAAAVQLAAKLPPADRRHPAWQDEVER